MKKMDYIVLDLDETRTTPSDVYTLSDRAVEVGRLQNHQQDENAGGAEADDHREMVTVYREDPFPSVSDEQKLYSYSAAYAGYLDWDTQDDLRIREQLDTWIMNNLRRIEMWTK